MDRFIPKGDTYITRMSRPFDSRPDLAALASEQGVAPAGDFDALLGDFSPEETESGFWRGLPKAQS